MHEMLHLRLQDGNLQERRLDTQIPIGKGYNAF